MTPEQLAKKVCELSNLPESSIVYQHALAALAEYGEAVRAEARKVCHTIESVKWNMHLSGKPTTLKCSDAIEKMELP